MKLTEDERIIIEALRKDKLLKKAIYNYFQRMSGIPLTFNNGKDNEKKEKR